jgi:hypothetical protein
MSERKGGGDTPPGPRNSSPTSAVRVKRRGCRARPTVVPMLCAGGSGAKASDASFGFSSSKDSRLFPSANRLCQHLICGSILLPRHSRRQPRVSFVDTHMSIWTDTRCTNSVETIGGEIIQTLFILLFNGILHTLRIHIHEFDI